MGSRKGSTWLVDAQFGTPEQNLIAAVVHKAIRDAGHARDAIRADALTYIRGRNFEDDCAFLGLDPVSVRARLFGPVEPAEPEPTRHIPDAQVRLIHAQYTRETHITLRDLARRHDTTAATLSRRFDALQLPARGRGRPNMTITPRRRKELS